MKVLIDCQGMQTGSAFRGIGRYAEGLIKGLIQTQGRNEIYLLLNGTLKSSAERVRDIFSDCINHNHFIYWYSVPEDCWTGSSTSILDSEILYEQAVLSISPDILLISSLFEGAGEPFYCPMERLSNKVSIANIVYDFIPYKTPQKYISGDYLLGWYTKQFNRLYFSDLFLCISEYVQKEAQLLFPAQNAINIWGGVDENIFYTVSDEEKRQFAQFLTSNGINKRFILYAGGADERKNIEQLIRAYSKSSEELKSNFQLVIVCGKYGGKHVHELISCEGIKKNTVALGYISDETLRLLYGCCYLFVFPSKEEGLGFSVLEAMQCGAPVISSCATSLPEVHGLEEAQFSPYDDKDLISKLEKFCMDIESYDRLKSHCVSYIQNFSWELTAEKVWLGLASLKLKDKKYKQLEVSELIDLMKFRSRNLNESQKLAIAIDKQFNHRLFFDVTECATGCYATRVQEIVNSIITELPPVIKDNYERVLVRKAGNSEGYESIQKTKDQWDPLGVIEPVANDVFVKLDLASPSTVCSRDILDSWKKQGVVVISVAYDFVDKKVISLAGASSCFS